MKRWHHAVKGQRCGFCGRVQAADAPILEVGLSRRCADCAQARYGETPPDPFPAPPKIVRPIREPAFATARQIRHGRRVADLIADVKARQTGERE